MRDFATGGDYAVSLVSSRIWRSVQPVKKKHLGVTALSVLATGWRLRVWSTPEQVSGASLCRLRHTPSVLETTDLRSSRVQDHERNAVAERPEVRRASVVTREPSMFDTVYISKTLPLPVEEAGRVVDRWHSRLGRACRGLPFLRAGRRLWITPCLQGPTTDPFVLRRGRAVLWVGIRPVRVEFELVSVPGTASVAFFPRSLPPVIESGRYERAIHKAVDDVVAGVSGAKPLRDSPLLPVPTPSGSRQAA
jgi:hypothetical protein